MRRVAVHLEQWYLQEYSKASDTWMLGVQALLLGIVHIIQALRGAGWAMGVIGIINIIFAVLLLGNVLLSMALLPWLFATFAIIGGISTIYMALRLRSA